MNNKLYVGNLSYDCSVQDLTDYFSQVGSLEDTYIVNDRNTGRSRGFAFVTFSSDEEANKAIEKFNEQEFMGRNLSVRIAQEKQERRNNTSNPRTFRKKSFGDDRRRRRS